MDGEEIVRGFGVFAVGIAIGAALGVMLYTKASAPKVAQASDGDSSRLARLGERVSDTRFHVHFNLWGMLVWLALLPPTILLWRNSVPYVVFMSWYANFVGHISAYIAEGGRNHGRRQWERGGVLKSFPAPNPPALHPDGMNRKLDPQWKRT